MAECSAESSKWMFLIHHVFLPPKLPQEDDTNGQLQEHLTQQAHENLLTFKAFHDNAASEKHATAIGAAIGAVSNLLRIHNFSSNEGDATVNAQKLEAALKDLVNTNPPRPIIIHVAAQNAGILLYRRADSVVLEIFELSAQNRTVIGTQGRLTRQFPGVAIQIPTDKLEPSLISTVARTLERMSSQVVPESIPTTSKNGRAHQEIRDTAHPKMVTELLAAFLLPFGQAAEVTSISKHTRDDVLWKDCKMPWRRSPLWLLIKLSIQLSFMRSGLDAQDALNLYKHFMVSFTVHILSQSTTRLKADLVCTEWCDLVYSMRAKISRRVLKLRTPLPMPIQDVMTDDILQQTWDDIRLSEAQASLVDIDSLRSLDFEKDTHAKLPKLDEFIDSIFKRKSETTQGKFTPYCRLHKFDSIADWSQWGNAGMLEEWGIIGAWCDHRISNLDAWRRSKLQEKPLDATSLCSTLWNDMEMYEIMVKQYCGQNPEAISLMVLGVMELWVACDQLACEECPLLLEYDPDIDMRRLQSLLLPFQPQMKRLCAVEDYIRRRQKDGIHKHIWTSFGQADTFAARYFDQSPNHKALRIRIEKSADEARNRKIEEYGYLKHEYSTLMNEVRMMECSEEAEIHNGQEFRFHRADSCGRCIKKDRAAGMNINIHEWPLPRAEADAKTVVFELDLPRWFSVWREATNLVRFKLLQCSYALENSPFEHQQFPLQADEHLSKYFNSRLPAGRSLSYGLLSSVKPNARTHYKGKSVSGLTKVDDVLFDNASRFRYFDFARGCMTAALPPLAGMESLTQSMIYRLPSKSRAVEQFIYRPPTFPDGPEPNVVLSSQSECPSHLSLTEYKALCTIPQGLLIQWQNILLEVKAPRVDFKKEDTTKVVLQCMYQAGPGSGSKSWYRDAHCIPAETEAFGQKMLEALRDATTRIEDNWRCIDELACYIAIARRILSLSPSDALAQDVLDYLSQARKIGLTWVSALKERADSATDNKKCRFRSRVAHAALVCVDTFNFHDTFSKGDDILGFALQSKPITDFILCCITIQECYTLTSDGIDPILYWRWQQLCFRAWPILHHAIVTESSDSLNVAIQASWVAFKPTGSGWTVSPISGCQHGGMGWLTTESASTSGGKNLAVHYCLVTGELRVNGFPLNRLPSEFEMHPMYKTLFGSSVLEVMPGDVPGLAFSGKKRYAGHEVHFGLSHGSGKQRVLLVSAVKNDTAWEIVDPKFLKGFPQRLVSGYVHWYDPSSNTVEFRPLDKPWATSKDNWSLESSETGEWRLTKENDRVLVVPKLLNAQSKTAERMDKIFAPLVEAADLELIYRPSSSLLEIELPHLKLDFHLEKGNSILQSRQFRGMSVDPDQTIGTLVGLENKLVLKSNSDDKRRKVILLEGPIITHSLRDSHAQVHVAKGAAVLSHPYNVDTRLGRLEDNGSLDSKLLLCYLHALTSFCLPDPMTARTGTEQALDILDSAAVKSLDVFSSKQTKILKKIASLTPKRLHYPRHLQVMQQVSWSANLGFLAQHNGFYKAVKSLFDVASDRSFLYKDRYIEPPKFKNTTAELVRRDEIRTAAFRVSQYGAEEHTTKDDRKYSSRDMGQDSAKAHSAFSIADYIVNRREQLPRAMPANPGQYVWNYLQEVAMESVLGAMHSPKLRESEGMPEYDAKWLLYTHNNALGRNLILYHELLSGRRQGMDKFDVAIWLSTLAFSEKADLPIIQLLASCVNSPALASIEPPPGVRNFTPCRGHVFVKERLLYDLDTDAVYRPFKQCPEYKASKGKSYGAQRQSRNQYNSLRRQALNPLVDCVKGEWPCAEPSVVNHPRRGEWETYVKTSDAMAIVWRHTLLWFQNCQLKGYVSRIVDLLPSARSVSVDALLAVKHSASETLPEDSPLNGFISKRDLFLCPVPPLGQLVSTTAQPVFPDDESTPEQEKSGQPVLLYNLLHRLDFMAQVAFEKEYVAKLQQSVNSLAVRKCESVHIPSAAVEIFTVHLAACQDQSSLIYKAICDELNRHMSSLFAAKLPRQDQEPVLAESCFSNYWPRLSPSFLLQHLAQRKGRILSPAWKELIVKYGVALVEQQRADRMMDAARRHDKAALSSELLNRGHENWDPMKYPDSLLLEVESGITIRPVQEEIAARMRSPPGGKNAVMQLNMGEGKSSVIVPIVASALADGESLVRIFVAKPQSKQMLEMLISKLGGLLDRVVFQMPTSRDLQITKSQAESMRKMLETCRDVGGVLLLQPEHALSLQQMGTEFAISPDKQGAAKVLNQNRHFLNRTARDIVDESDENFSVKFELVYTMGPQQPADHSPQRWQIIQEVLDLVHGIAPEVQHNFPDAIEVHDTSSPGSFPRTRVLKSEAMQRIRDELAKRICEAGLTGFPISRQSPAVRDAVRTYITKADLSDEEIKRVEGPAGFWTESVRPTLALLRGLMACNVLGFPFMQKRWRVNYGLTSDRRPPTPLAVPYPAKDQPSARSEFSHPDVVIILTCLAYYYGGLTDDQLFLTFDQLLESDQAEIEYERWVRGNAEIPVKFRSLAGVNTEDTAQCVNDVFPHLRLSKAVIDYFLGHIVYPKAMKEFPSKLSSSGWDLGEQKDHPTTGFSGTNDSRRLLPLGMEQLDLDEQNHTNALVMSYLLQPEMSVIDVPPRSSIRTKDADVLLDLVVSLDPPVRVILDVGAQVLELDNLGVARQWLGRVTDDHTHAAVFFDDNDELSVVDRNGHIERLQTSPFASQMDACIIFLDEAHTRGTDLKFPTDYRAAVTLGANQTKDVLMQGCMRMRNLGHGQSVVFCVPREVKMKIRELLPEDRTDDDIQVSDILVWSIRETWNSLQRGVQLWATQGRRHEKHQALWNEYTGGERELNADQAKDFLEDEAQTILERYRPEASSKQEKTPPRSFKPGETRDFISERLRDFGVSRCDTVTLHEEQERELAPEIETERQTELPPPTAHAPNSIHPDITTFATNGTMVPNSEAYICAFESLSNTRAGQAFGVSKTSPVIAPRLFVTADFARTVKLPKVGGFSQDSYLRSVQWVLVSRQDASKLVMLILSPFEANKLLFRIWEAEKTTLYLYSPRINPAYPSLDDLSLFPFPRENGEPIPLELTVALNLFAGQLYFNDYDMYVAACKFLGLSSEKAKDGEILDADGFILRDGEGRIGGGSGFRDSPVKFIRDLTLMRRDHKTIGRTHVGDMLDSRVLSEETFK